MEPQPPLKDYPRFGRDALDHPHAPYAIVLLLQQLGLSDWTSILLGWLGRYDGVEEYLHLEEDPACRTRDVLMRHAVEAAAADAQHPPSQEVLQSRKTRIVHDLLQLDFLRCTAYWGPLLVKTMPWKPLEQSWMSFLDQVPPHDEHDGEEGMHVWLSDEADPKYVARVRDLLMGVASEPVRDRDDNEQRQR
jgi:hypothetical protein